MCSTFNILSLGGGSITHYAGMGQRITNNQATFELTPNNRGLIPVCVPGIKLLSLSSTSEAHLPDLVLEPRHLRPCVLDAGEHVRQQREEQRDVLSHQFGHHGLAHTLDQDLPGEWNDL